VTLRGWAGGDHGRPRIGFGEATGTIVPTPGRTRANNPPAVAGF
jgi:hypothetical protein